MKQEDGKFLLPPESKAAGANLYWQIWLPDDKPKALILLVHGYAEHSGRYQYFAKHCLDRGYAVFAMDHWGHGKSDGTPGFVPDFSVFHGPAVKAAEEPSAFLKAISGFLSRFFPKLGVLELDPNGVSRDPKVVADYLADPLVYNGKMGARLAAEMLSNMTRIQENSWQVSLPILLLHGGKDSLAAAEGSKYLDSHIASIDKTLKIYPELFHEIFNEPEKDEVLNDMTDWLDTRLSANKG